MTVRTNLSLSDDVAASLDRKLSAEKWRKGNRSQLVNEILFKYFEKEEGSVEKDGAGKQ